MSDGFVYAIVGIMTLMGQIDFKRLFGILFTTFILCSGYFYNSCNNCKTKYHCSINSDHNPVTIRYVFYTLTNI